MSNADENTPEGVEGVDYHDNTRRYKCDQCGRTYDTFTKCVGGEYPHPPVDVRPTREVLAEAEGAEEPEPVSEAFGPGHQS